MKIVIELNDDIDEQTAQDWIDAELILKEGVKDCYLYKHCGKCKITNGIGVQAEHDIFKNPYTNVIH